ncbi:indolepyruvate oxidoreductase subunit beta [Desulfitobacterium sp.]|uniref:indolepyruvate oxidoreductase subunit beta n=1 Tax=Desulfitobacterium sp. TaxID=49981 RepID=UPI002B1EA362|nr:indolepyruvate oxidoreductase subunit beta [Desulfitobacterium sp.]MEA4900305.1 indolepyruvate oxidoreductase subunit beta [Desulfitobacterium sp.]
MKETKNILLVGVGGQGIILVSNILAAGLIKVGYDVKMSEIHGMSQRGGSVTTQVRFGEKVYSPIIGQGQADVLVAFEKMEAARWVEYLKPAGKIVVNNYEIPSITIASGQAQYPQGVIDALEKVFNTTAIDASQVAQEVGNIRTQNIVLLGALVKALQFNEMNEEDWIEILQENLPAKMVDINIKAFQQGYKL